MPTSSAPAACRTDRTPDVSEVERGKNPDGKPDEAPKRRSRGLPKERANYRISGTNKRIDRLIREKKPRPRINTYFPYLIIRSVPGDTGARPLPNTAVSWESCDIHLMPEGTTGFDFAQTVLQP